MKRYIKNAIAPLGNEDFDTRKELARDKEADSNVIEQLSSDRNRKVREQIARNPNTSVDVLKKLSTDKSYKVKLAVAKNPNTTSEILSAMYKQVRPMFTDYADTRYLDLGAEIFKNSNTPLTDRLDLLKASAMRYMTDIVRNVARNKNTPIELLEAIGDKAIKSEYGYVLEALAKNRNTPIELLNRIVKESIEGYYSTDIVGALARNPNTPTEALVLLLNYKYLYDEDRDAILKHHNLHKDIAIEVKEKLAEEQRLRDLSTYVGKDIWLAGETFGISRGHECYFRLLSRIKGKYERYKANIIFEKTSWNENPIEHQMSEVEVYNFDGDSADQDSRISRIYRNPITAYTTEELLAKLYPNQLAEDANQYTRVNIAKNPNTPPELLTKLATDRSNKVKIAVAGNPNTPSDVLCSIVPNYGDIVDDTRYLDALLKNSNTPLEYRKQLVDAAYNYRHRYPQDSRYIEILKKLVTKKHTPKELVRYIENQEIELLEYWREKMPERYDENYSSPILVALGYAED